MTRSLAETSGSTGWRPETRRRDRSGEEPRRRKNEKQKYGNYAVQESGLPRWTTREQRFPRRRDIIHRHVAAAQRERVLGWVATRPKVNVWGECGVLEGLGIDDPMAQLRLHNSDARCEDRIRLPIVKARINRSEEQIRCWVNIDRSMQMLGTTRRLLPPIAFGLCYPPRYRLDLLSSNSRNSFLITCPLVMTSLLCLRFVTTQLVSSFLARTQSCGTFKGKDSAVVRPVRSWLNRFRMTHSFMSTSESATLPSSAAHSHNILSSQSCSPRCSVL